MKSRTYRALNAPTRSFGLGKFGNIVMVAVAAAIWVYVLDVPHQHSFTPLPAANSSSTPRAIRMREFEALFEGATPLAELARRGQYTVVEVYTDDCIVCREFEEAFAPFNSRRADVSLIRVHYPSGTNHRIRAKSDEDYRQQVEDIDSRISSYGLCTSPHLEVYGPDRKPLARDSCTSRDGTAFMRDWITHETEAESGPTYMLFVKIVLGYLILYVALLSLDAYINDNKKWWYHRFSDAD